MRLVLLLQCHGQFRLPADPAEALVVTIRREEFGFEGEVLGGGALQAKQNARLARALKRLAGELYGSDVHWQLELLQNADDNSYNPGQSPTAEFLLRQGEVAFRCNEAGFRASDIRAICDIGNSSKVGTAKYSAGGRVMATGEKGLGFKAVFALTDAPRIYSGPYRIEFDCKHPAMCCRGGSTKRLRLMLRSCLPMGNGALLYECRFARNCCQLKRSSLSAWKSFHRHSYSS